MIRTDRWNGGTLRRYHLRHAILVVSRSREGRTVRVIPRCFPAGSVSVPCSAEEAARQLRVARWHATAKKVTP